MSGGTCVEDKEAKCFNANAGGECIWPEHQIIMWIKDSKNRMRLATLGTQDTGRRKKKKSNTTQHRKLKFGVNPGVWVG